MKVAPTFTELIMGLWDSMEGEKYENCGKRFERVEKEAPKELITERLLSVRVLTFRGVVLEAGKMPLWFDLLLLLFIKLMCLYKVRKGRWMIGNSSLGRMVKLWVMDCLFGI